MLILLRLCYQLLCVVKGTKLPGSDILVCLNFELRVCVLVLVFEASLWYLCKSQRFDMLHTNKAE